MALTNSSDYQLASLGQTGKYILSSANPWYSTSVDSVNIFSVTTTGDQATYKLLGSPDLSKVIEGAYVNVRGLEDAKNNGIKVIVSADNAAGKIVVDNDGVPMVEDLSPRVEATLSVSGRKTVAMQVTADLAIDTLVERNVFGADPATSVTYSADNFYYGDYEEITVTGTSRAIIYFNPVEQDPENKY